MSALENKVRVYKFCDEKWGLDNLKRRRIKISTLKDLNDPFELNGFSLADPKQRKAWEAARAQTYAKYGMVCFSRNWDNPVIWSHYAHRHTGICLGFDVPDKYIAQVRYATRRERIEDFALLTDNERNRLAMDSMKLKYSHWRYEKEFRVFCKLSEVEKESGLYFKLMDEFCELKEVVIGPCSGTSASDLYKAAGHTNFKVTCSMLSQKTFRVVKQM